MARVTTAEQVPYCDGEWHDLSDEESARVGRIEVELMEMGMDPEYAHELALLTLQVVDEHDPGFDLLGRARSLRRQGCGPGLIYKLLR